jgi:hypothetical protein
MISFSFLLRGFTVLEGSFLSLHVTGLSLAFLAARSGKILLLAPPEAMMALDLLDHVLGIHRTRLSFVSITTNKEQKSLPSKVLSFSEDAFSMFDRNSRDNILGRSFFLFKKLQ